MFIRRPGTPGHEDFSTLGETLYLRKRFCPLCNGINAIETGVAGHFGIYRTDPLEQLQRLFVLYEQPVERTQHPAEQPPPRFKKRLPGPENPGDQVSPRTAALQCEQVVGPKLVFDEYGDLRTENRNEPPGIARRIGRQVKNVVGSRIILADFVSGRREKGQQYLPAGMRGPERFDHGTSLLEFTERCTVEPDQVGSGRAMIRTVPRSCTFFGLGTTYGKRIRTPVRPAPARNRLRHPGENTTAATAPQPRLIVKHPRRMQPGIEQINPRIVKQTHAGYLRISRNPCGFSTTTLSPSRRTRRFFAISSSTVCKALRVASK